MAKWGNNLTDIFQSQIEVGYFNKFSHDAIVRSVELCTEPTIKSYIIFLQIRRLQLMIL